MLTEALAEQPKLLVTVTEYLPADETVIDLHLIHLTQRYNGNPLPASIVMLEPRQIASVLD